MLHSTIVASEAAQETSTKAVRHRQTQVVPRGSYNFGDGDIRPGSCVTIEPKPVRNIIVVHQSAVAPDSLPGGALPRDTAVMPTGEMRGLGEPLAAVPAAFRHGVMGDRRAILGGKEVRRVGNSLVPMAAPMRDFDRSPIPMDRNYLNRSGGAAVMPSYGLAPDDRLRQKLIRPTQPGMTVERTPLVYEQPGQVLDSRTQYESRPIAYESSHLAEEPCIVPGSVEDMCGAGDEECRQTMNYCGRPAARRPSTMAVGLVALALAGGVYWLTIREN